MAFSSTSSSSVKVAVRIRPLVPSEASKGFKDVLDVVEKNDQIVIKSLGKAFTFNYVFPGATPQEEVYSRCVCPLTDNLFKGYNVTVLAYGQTGSGKTHSMGTTYKGQEEIDLGIIPRAVKDIFNVVRDSFSIDFNITVSFMELYNECLYDLLSNKPKGESTLEIREDTIQGIHVPSLTHVTVKSAAEVLEALARGTVDRATAATNMNSESSRSHAIFTINLSMVNKDDCKENKQARLNFVDLAGSERPKKTGAVGNTFKEGVNINKGLFVLGNVISALGDEKTCNGFIPYRNSNLTRILKDSLGGNSITLMIACVSPADYNLDETLSTLNYADRAKKIKNKPIVNQDARAAEINQLKKTIQQLRLQIVADGGGGEAICPAEIELLKKQILDLSNKNRELTQKLFEAVFDKTDLHEKILILQNSNDVLNKKVSEIKQQYDLTFSNISINLEKNDNDQLKENLHKLQEIQMQFAELKEERQKTEREIKNHEAAFHKSFVAVSNTSLDKSSEEEDATEMKEQRDSHTKKQMALNEELQDIQKQLHLKETLVQQLLINNENIIDYQAMTEYEEKIAVLEKERNELVQQLKQVLVKGPVDNKVSEQRKKRVKELETKLADFKRKFQEQARLIKLKEKDEQRLKKLNEEIVGMKQMKVKLMKQMKSESERFREWKSKKERECDRLKAEDRKKQTEINKMKVKHSKQETVFRRRVEEAEALNKRLKQALALRKQVQDSKNTGKTDQLGPWLQQEYEMFLDMVEAKVTLDALLEDRATLQQHLNDLKSDPETANSPDCKSVEDDLELRSVQIHDLQQKILDSDEECKSKTRFAKIQTMADAKFALKMLFEQMATMQKEQIRSKLKTNEKVVQLQEQVNEFQEKLEKINERHKQYQEKMVEEMGNLEKMHEEKIMILLSQMRRIKKEGDEEDHKKTLNEIQLETINKQELKIQELQQKLQYVNDLAQQEKRRQEECNTPVLTVSRSTFNIPNEPKDKENEINMEGTFLISAQDTDTPVKPRLTIYGLADNEKDINSDESFGDDVNKDPDWRKTPLGKRVLEQKQRKLRATNLTLPGNEETVKRSSDGGCTCMGRCNTSRCGCRKLGRVCSTSSCRCDNKKCENSNDNILKSTDTTDLHSNYAFKKPRVTSVNEERNSRRKNTHLFNLDL